MSFILDALRKSEAARRRSETPDLFASLPQAQAPVHNRAAWPLWAMAGFGALSSAIALWLLLHRPDTPAAAASTTTASIATEAGGDAHDDNAAIDNASVDAGDDGAAAVPAPAPAPSVAATPAPPAPKPLSAAVPAPSLPPVSAASSPTAPAVAPPPAPPPSTTNDRPTALADLAPDVRRQLPPLKLSMQVWNEDPQRRFVILDGQRLREGDTAGDVVVERITRTEVLLSWRGARLRLPAE